MVDVCHVYYADIWSRGDTSRLQALLDPAFVRRDLCGLAAGWGAGGSSGNDGTAGGGMGLGMVVGPRAFRAQLDDVRRQYPDYRVEVEEVAVSDTHRIFVSWTSHGTQLEGPDPWVAAHAYEPAHAAQDARHQPHHHPHQHQHHYGEKRPLFAPASPLWDAAGDAASGAGHAASAPSTGAGQPRPAASYRTSLVRGVDLITFNRDRSKILEVNVFRTLSSDERRQLARSLAPDPLEIRLARLHWETT